MEVAAGAHTVAEGVHHHVGLLAVLEGERRAGGLSDLRADVAAQPGQDAHIGGGAAVGEGAPIGVAIHLGQSMAGQPPQLRSAHVIDNVRPPVVGRREIVRAEAIKGANHGGLLALSGEPIVRQLAHGLVEHPAQHHQAVHLLQIVVRRRVRHESDCNGG